MCAKNWTRFVCIKRTKYVHLGRFWAVSLRSTGNGILWSTTAERFKQTRMFAWSILDMYDKNVLETCAHETTLKRQRKQTLSRTCRLGRARSRHIPRYAKCVTGLYNELIFEDTCNLYVSYMNLEYYLWGNGLSSNLNRILKLFSECFHTTTQSFPLFIYVYIYKWVFDLFYKLWQ